MAYLKRIIIASAVAAICGSAAKAGELDALIKSSDESVLSEYLRAQAAAGKIEPDFSIDSSGDGNVHVIFMGPYMRSHPIAITVEPIRKQGAVPHLGWFQAAASQYLARTWGHQLCDAMERSQHQRGTNKAWTIIIDAWVLPSKNAAPKSVESEEGYDEVLRCHLGANFSVAITKKYQVER
jgi:hypothetical protein